MYSPKVYFMVQGGITECGVCKEWAKGQVQVDLAHNCFCLSKSVSFTLDNGPNIFNHFL